MFSSTSMCVECRTEANGLEVLHERSGAQFRATFRVQQKPAQLVMLLTNQIFVISKRCRANM